MTRRFYRAVRKTPDEFCAEGLPWKATNGIFCCDAKTREEAEKEANRRNQYV